jgi:c-di-GMP-binding flagellar brake protein YcgR
MDRRRFTRHEVAVPVRIKAGEHELHAETVDISAGGMALKLESALLAGSKVSVVIDGLGEFSADMVSADGSFGRLRLDLAEDDQSRLADDIVRKLAHLLPV